MHEHKTAIPAPKILPIALPDYSKILLELREAEAELTAALKIVRPAIKTFEALVQGLPKLESRNLRREILRLLQDLGPKTVLELTRILQDSEFPTRAKNFKYVVAQTMITLRADNAAVPDAAGWRITSHGEDFLRRSGFHLKQGKRKKYELRKDKS